MHNYNDTEYTAAEYSDCIPYKRWTQLENSKLIQNIKYIESEQCGILIPSKIFKVLRNMIENKSSKPFNIVFLS